uniref:Putative secreted protein n=1 Tax=Anopheles darlingi TaxID=43151 RepID=A0A2M4DB81_ANODA
MIPLAGLLSSFSNSLATRFQWNDSIATGQRLLGASISNALHWYPHHGRFYFFDAIRVKHTSISEICVVEQ